MINLSKCEQAKQLKEIEGRIDKYRKKYGIGRRNKSKIPLILKSIVKKKYNIHIDFSYTKMKGYVYRNELAKFMKLIADRAYLKGYIARIVEENKGERK